MKNLKEVELAIIDNGFYVSLAEKLAKEVKKVYYWTPSLSPFPRESDEEIGSGFHNIKRVYGNVEQLFDKCDGFIFPDSNFREMAQYLKDHKKPVWGAANAEWLESDRWRYREFQEKNKIYHPETTRVIGTKNIFNFLANKKDVYIKTSRTRGDFETFHWIDNNVSKYELEKIFNKLGPLQEDNEVIIDSPINDAVEIGYDGTIVNGQFPKICSWGIEMKDEVYLGKITHYDNLPEQIKETNNSLLSILSKEKTSSFLSTEVRVNKKGNFLIDPCIRAGNPPFLAELELFSNWAEHIWNGMNGIIVNLKPVARYMGFAFIHSSISQDEWMKASFPESDKNWYKFYNIIKSRKEYWIAPFRYELGVIGAIVSIGNTIDSVINLIKTRTKNLLISDSDVSINEFDNAKKQLSTLKKEYGIEF